jgi:hypothetical protein
VSRFLLPTFLCGGAAAKKSRCRPAQGRRLHIKHRIADAIDKRKKAQKPRRVKKPYEAS